MGAYGSVAIDLIITVFILLFSVNFAVYFLLLTRKFRDILASDELRFFLTVVAGSTLLIAWNIRGLYSSFAQALRYAVFQVASVISTTGFATADFTLWPQLSPSHPDPDHVLRGLAPGPSGGGMKCSRILILGRSLRREIHRIVHPRSVEVVTLDGKVVEEETIHSVLTFIGSYFLVILTGALIISLDNFSFSVSFSAALTCVSNVGPGLELIGPAGELLHLLPPVQAGHGPVHDRGAAGDIARAGLVQP